MRRHSTLRSKRSLVSCQRHLLTSSFLSSTNVFSHYFLHHSWLLSWEYQHQSWENWWEIIDFESDLLLIVSINKQNEYWLSVAGVLHIEMGLKMQVYVLRWFTVVSDYCNNFVENVTQCPWLKTTHTCIHYTICDCMGWNMPYTSCLQETGSTMP